jgi:hypothetical protein
MIGRCPEELGAEAIEVHLRVDVAGVGVEGTRAPSRIHARLVRHVVAPSPLDGSAGLESTSHFAGGLPLVMVFRQAASSVYVMVDLIVKSVEFVPSSL